MNCVVCGISPGEPRENFNDSPVLCNKCYDSVNVQIDKGERIIGKT